MSIFMPSGRRFAAVSALVVATLGPSQMAQAAYERASSTPVRVVNIYANEYGSPFVQFDNTIHNACSAGRGLYLYNLELPNNAQLRNNKMAIILTALSGNRPVVLDFFFDATRVGNWDACYIHGVYLN